MAKMELIKAMLQELGKNLLQGLKCYSRLHEGGINVDGGMGKALLMYGRASHPAIGEDKTNCYEMGMC